MDDANLLLTSGEVAARVGLTRSRLLYLIERRLVPGPTYLVPGRRLFTPADVALIDQALSSRPATCDGAGDGRKGRAAARESGCQA